MTKPFKLVLQGLATVLPLGLTLYFIYWLAISAEGLFKPILLKLLPQSLYFPGMGILAAVLFLFCLGILVNAYVIRYLIQLGEKILEKIPLVKSVYGGVQDLTQFLTLSGKKQAKSVVSLDIGNGMQLIGFLTGEKTGQKFFGNGETEKVGVYLPMSYQVGGYTVYVDKDRLEPLDIGIEEAMRLIITGGMQRSEAVSHGKR